MGRITLHETTDGDQAPIPDSFKRPRPSSEHPGTQPTDLMNSRQSFDGETTFMYVEL